MTTPARPAPWLRRLRALFWSRDGHGRWSTLPIRRDARVLRRLRLRCEATDRLWAYCREKKILPLYWRNDRGVTYSITPEGRCAYCGGPPCDASKHFE